MSSFDEASTVYNGQYEVEVFIHCPVARVWAQFVDVGSWVLSHEIEYVLGAPDSVGSVTRVSFKRAKEFGFPPAHYHFCKIIKLTPERHYLLKTYSEVGGSYGLQIVGFDDVRFAAIGDGTQIVFNIFCEMKSELIAKDPGAMNLDASRHGMIENLNNLKRIVEK
jgi:hypothetical protein